MEKIQTLSIWSLIFMVNAIVDAQIGDVQVQPLCEVDLTKFVESSDNKCLQVATYENIDSACIIKLHASYYASLQSRSHKYFKHRDISLTFQGYCETFLIFVERLEDLTEIFELNQRRSKPQFFPFSKMYFFVLSESFNDSVTTNMDSMVEVKNFLTRNALFGYLLDVTKDEIGYRQVVVKDLLTNDVKRPILSYTPSDLLHPTVDTRLAKDNFRISLFNCKPFTFYPENASDNTIIEEIDGTEYRFVKEVTKNWKKTFNFRDFSRTKVSPFDQIIDDLLNKTSDLAMCSLWILGKEEYDSTTYYQQVCSTFLVPKPQKLNEATAVYTALSLYVWLSFLFFFVLSSLLLNYISKMEKRLYQRESRYTDFTGAVLETINTATSHSVHRFPSQNGQVPVKILLTSWIWLSVWIGIVYTTTYTSRLTSPSYEKPIDTVKQFSDHDLHICGRYVMTDLVQIFSSSINEDYRTLGSRSLVYGEKSIYRKQLFDERMCGIFVNRPTKNYVGETDVHNDAEVMLKLRIMRSCVLQYYSGFAFQKYSPYTKLFDFHIRRYQEHGIIQNWYLDVSRQQRIIKSIFHDYPEQDFRRQINLVNVSGAFCLLGVGLFFSVTAFFVEYIRGGLQF